MGDSSYVGPMGMAGPAIIADAYDLYADQLYAYCRFFARDPADAVDALENIFLVAAGRGAALPLDGQLRTWLFAVARNECLRGIRTRRATPRPDRFPGGTAEGRARRELLTAASGGLVPGDRDLIAMLWHGLDADDMAAVLGIGREESFARLEAALGHLETAVTALLVARGGGRDCAVLARLLGRWNGGLDAPLVQKVTQHAERCGRCLSRRQGELRPALRLSLTPAALLGAGVSAEALRPAAASVAELRDQVLALACDPSAEGGEARRRACGLAGPFGLALPPDAGQPASRAGSFSQWTGFPVPLPAEPGRGLPRSRLTVALTGTAVAALTVVAAFAAAGPRVHDSRSAVASASLSPAIGVPTAVTLRWNAGQRAREGVLTVTVKGGGPLAWSVSDQDQGLRLSQVSGTSSAVVSIIDPGRGDLRPLLVTSGNAAYTVTLRPAG